VKNPNQSQNMFITASESSKDERFFNGTLWRIQSKQSQNMFITASETSS
jgi:hypothetical protein